MDFLNADVPDPTEFPPQALAPGLRALDGSFRCDICGELFDAPATISCGHCFCSTCIRVCLSTKQECPSCRKPAGEAHIRPNPVLEKAISDWKDARPFILRLVKQEEDRALSRNKRTATKRNRETMERDSSTDLSIAGPSHHSSPPNGKQKKARATSEDIMDMTIPSSDADEQEIYVPKAGDLVKCPICDKRVRYEKLNGHIDNGCKESSKKGESAANTWSKIMGGKKAAQHKGKHKQNDSDDEYPLPIQTYTTLKDRQLKEMLQEYNLPITGDRSNWEQRHKWWVTLYNANLDRSKANRKKKTELRKDLKRWEDESSKRKKVVVPNIRQHQIDHKDDFAKLIIDARQSRQSKTISKPTIGSAASTPLVTDVRTPTPIDQGSSSRSSTADRDDVIVVDSEGER